MLIFEKKSTMNISYLHLLINHFPILGFVFGILVLVAGMISRNNSVKLAAFGLFVFSALMAIPAFLTGEPAEDTVKNIAGITEDLISTHEKAASLALWFVIPTGLISLLAFWSVWKNDRLAKALTIITLLLSMGVSIMMFWVGKTGGQIRHSEFRQGLQTPVVPDVESEDND